MPRYDVHQHMWPPEVLAHLRGRSAPPFIRDGMFQAPGLPPAPVRESDHDLEQRLAWLAEAGLDIAVVSLSPTDGFDAELRELWHTGIAAVAAASGGRIRPLADGAPRAGFGGVSVAADAVTAGLPRSLAWDLEAAGQMLFVHPGPPAPAPPGVPAWWLGALDYCMQMQRAFTAWLARDAARYPALPAVFAILGGGAPLLAERFEVRGAGIRLGEHPNTVVDTASYGPHAIGQFIAMHGTDQLVHGSDAPVLGHCAAAGCLQGLGSGVADAVIEATPTRILGERRG